MAEFITELSLYGLTQATSHVRQLPLLYGNTVVLSGLLLSVLSRPTGSSQELMPAAVRARFTTSLCLREREGSLHYSGKITLGAKDGQHERHSGMSVVHIWMQPTSVQQRF